MTLPMVVMLGGLGLAAPAPSSTAPPEIAAYYRDYNFVNAFSTMSERHTLAYGVRPGMDERLGRIASLMQRLDSQVEDLDPGINRPESRLPLTAMRADLLEIKSVRVNEEKDEAWVDLNVLSLEPPVVVLYVSRFTELAGRGRTPALEELRRLHRGSFQVMSQERHKWTRGDAGWRRAAAIHHFIAR